MALVEANVRVGVTGAVYSGPVGTTAPTTTATAVSPRIDLGYVSEDGVTRTLPDAGDATVIKAWQNGATVRVIRTASEDNPTFSFTLLETKLETVQFALGVTVTQTVTEGSYVIDTTAAKVYKDLILDVIDGSSIERTHLPKAMVTEVGDLVYKNDEPYGYQVTVTAERDSTLGYNAKVFATALKS
jgi:hypothetical protein